MSTKLPIGEFGRRICVASHHAEYLPGPTGGVPCAEHRRMAQLYYGLIDDRFRAVAKTISEIVNELEAEGE